MFNGELYSFWFVNKSYFDLYFVCCCGGAGQRFSTWQYDAALALAEDDLKLLTTCSLSLVHTHRATMSLCQKAQLAQAQALVDVVFRQLRLLRKKLM